MVCLNSVPCRSHAGLLVALQSVLLAADLVIKLLINVGNLLYDALAVLVTLIERDHLA